MNKMKEQKISSKSKKLNRLTVYVLDKYHVRLFEWFDEIKKSYILIYKKRLPPYPKLNVRELMATTLFSEEGHSYLVDNKVSLDDIKRLEKEYKRDYYRSKRKVFFEKVRHFITGK